MATNIYGSCTGASSGKYDIWATVSENSVSSENNSSNVTVKVCIKRNDGYSSSAYNLYESSNSIVLTVAEEVRVDKNLTVDTRGNTTVVLASWTGDVVHNNDGTLGMSVTAEFVMGNTSLSGGSVDGEFRCSTIARASSFVLDCTTVNPGTVITATVSSVSQGFSHRIQWRLGSQTQSIELAKGVLVSRFTVPTEWISELTDSTSATLSVILTTFNGTVTVGSKIGSAKFILPATDEYKPSFDISVTRSNAGVAESIDEYIKGVSTVTVNAVNMQFKYGAKFSAVTVTVGGVSVRSIPATITLNDCGDVDIAVAVRDSRGLVAVRKVIVEVCDYSPPSVVIKELFRCDENGVACDTGVYASVSIDSTFSSINGKNSSCVTLKYRNTKSDCYNDIGETNSSVVVFGGDIEVGDTYEVVLAVKDTVTEDELLAVGYVSGGAVPFNIRKGGKGASFGKYSEQDGLLDIEWDMRVGGNMNILGTLNYNDIGVTATDYIANMISTARYYPCLGMVYLRLRLETAKELSADTTYYVAEIGDYPPNLYTPLSCNGSFYTSNQYSAGIVYESGKLSFRCTQSIPVGTMIYISGFYIADYK